MTAEAPTRKSWEKEPIPAAEWRANMAATKAVKEEDSAEFRLTLKRKIAVMLGTEYRPENAKRMHTKLAVYLVGEELLARPEWHEKSTLHLDHFLTEELAECYNFLKSMTTKPKPNLEEVADDEDPF